MLDSRPLIDNVKEQMILLDSSSIDTLLSCGNDGAKLLLSYHQQEGLSYARSPFNTSWKELQSIPEFKLERRPIQPSSIHVEYSRSESYRAAVSLQSSTVRQCASLIYGSKFRWPLSELDQQTVELPIIASQLHGDARNCILVTEKRPLLSNRMRLQTKCGLNNLVIADVGETRDILDTWLKSNGKYLLAPSTLLSRAEWYNYSVRTKLTYAQYTDDDIGALATRYRFILIATDELTKHYYSGPTIDALEMQIYHFNYLLTLAAGVLDSIALSAKDRFKIAFKGDNNPSRTSLNAKSGTEFLKALKQENPDLRRHISNHSSFISGIFELREEIVHRRMHPTVALHVKSQEGDWSANMLRVPETIRNKFIGITSKTEEHDVLGPWGIYRLAGEYHIEPVRFSKSLNSHLRDFINESLRLLGSEDYMASEGETDQEKRFLALLHSFKQNTLAM